MQKLLILWKRKKSFNSLIKSVSKQHNTSKLSHNSSNDKDNKDKDRNAEINSFLNMSCTHALDNNPNLKTFLE